MGWQSGATRRTVESSATLKGRETSMKSPADMKIIMIDITNACQKACSNCTRFCGEHSKPFMMEEETFQRAVDSMNRFRGTVGIIGGEPTLHPKFDAFLDYLAEKIPEPRPWATIRHAVPSFKAYHSILRYQRGRRRGLFTSLGSGYYRHFEQIQDVFPYQSINDHQAVNNHQALMVTRKELGIPDEEWFKLRDKCWIQNLWSATITPKGAFFCEIAGSLDMLFDGPGGWPLEPGWWRRKPADFGAQLDWCEMCSAALRVPMEPATTETDIVSPLMAEKLKTVNGPKVRSGRIKVFAPAEYNPENYSKAGANPIWYFPEGQGDNARVSPTHGTLFPRRVDVVVLDGESDKGSLTREKLEALDFTDWVAVFRNANLVNQEFLERVPKCILNPGYLYRHRDDVWLFNRRARALAGRATIRFDEALCLGWEPRKRVGIASYPRIGELTAVEKLKLLAATALHRGAFILPVLGRGALNFRSSAPFAVRQDVSDTPET
jgi:hypothetical protein